MPITKFQTKLTFPKFVGLLIVAFVAFQYWAKSDERALYEKITSFDKSSATELPLSELLGGKPWHRVCAFTRFLGPAQAKTEVDVALIKNANSQLSVFDEDEYTWVLAVSSGNDVSASWAISVDHRDASYIDGPFVLKKHPEMAAGKPLVLCTTNKSAGLTKLAVPGSAHKHTLSLTERI